MQGSIRGRFIRLAELTRWRRLESHHPLPRADLIKKEHYECHCLLTNFIYCLEYVL